MPTVTIAPVTRKNMKLLLSFYGMSETGKTLSALRVAAGIEPDPNKRGLLDTEGGERGRAYADSIPGGFLYGSLTPPFTPERYSEALMDFIAAGVTTLVVDSVSHAWFAAGGVLDMVENATNANEVAKWAKPKRRLGKLTGQWMQCGLHLILCSRGKQPLLEDTSPTGKKIYVPGPVVPIQEKSLRYDMTVMAHMLGDGRFTVARPDGKCPGALRPIFAAHDIMDEEMGKRLIGWVGGMNAMTAEQRTIAMQAEAAAAEGSDAFRAWLTTAGAKLQREFLLTQMDNFRSIAKAADAEKARLFEEQRAAELANDHDAPFAGPAISGGVTKLTGPLVADSTQPNQVANLRQAT